MNLWQVFPESLLDVTGILYLPYLAIAFYLYVLYTLIKQPEHRATLALFLGLTLSTSLVMVVSLGPRIGVVLAPLLLISVMLMPITMLVLKVLQKERAGIQTWAVVTVAGWLHSLSWVVWLFALARS